MIAEAIENNRLAWIYDVQTRTDDSGERQVKVLGRVRCLRIFPQELVSVENV